MAGSVLTLDRAVRNAMNFVPLTLQEAVRLVTLNPARMLGLDDGRGQLVTGGIADLVVLTPAGEVTATMAAGQFS